MGHLFLVAFVPLSACATIQYSAEPIEAKVIDADTKQPLEGVIVTANWALISGNAGGSTPVGQLMVLETTTDKGGVFRFPAWGPLRPKQGVLFLDDPQLLLFKSRYDYRRLNNYRSGVALEGLWETPVRTSQWNGKAIEMKLFTGAAKQYVNRFRDFNSDLERIIDRNPEDCRWKQLTEAIAATERERRRIIAETVGQKEVDPRTVGSVFQNILYNDDWYTKKGGLGCGSPRQFLKRYEP